MAIEDSEHLGLPLVDLADEDVRANSIPALREFQVGIDSEVQAAKARLDTNEARLDSQSASINDYATPIQRATKMWTQSRPVNLTGNVTVTAGALFRHKATEEVTITIGALSDGDPLILFDPDGSLETYPVTIARGSKTLNGVSDDILVNNAGAKVVLIYNAATNDMEIF